MEMKTKQITSCENEILMQSMRENVTSQNEPKVGLFWYNPERNRLCGVSSAFASELPFNKVGRKTVRTLHRTTWDKVRKDAIAIGSSDAIWQEKDYTQIPRGRVFQNDVAGEPYFEILVGSWLEDYPHAAELIIEEFNLSDSNYDFVHSVHWDIGYGTSELFI